VDLVGEPGGEELLVPVAGLQPVSRVLERPEELADSRAGRDE
jgi:hypothetical protein